MNIILLNSHDSWQASKLLLLTLLSSPDDIFLDADLRFNASLPPINSITFFVKEETFLVKQINKSLDKLEPLVCTNRNTSVFTWGGKTPNLTQLKILDEIYENLEQILVEGTKYDEYIGRLREQVSISIFVDMLGFEVEFIKMQDGQFDGELVESSYFGATGSRFTAFGRHGLRSRVYDYFFGKSKNS